jgi:hypothetical protein
VVVEDPTSNNPNPSGKKQKKKRGNWGGRRPGAGAPKGNLNGFKQAGAPASSPRS